jgi:archaellin
MSSFIVIVTVHTMAAVPLLNEAAGIQQKGKHTG